MKQIREKSVIRVFLSFTVILSIFIGQSDATCTSSEISEFDFVNGFFFNTRKIEPGAGGVGIVAEFNMQNTVSVDIRSNPYLAITFSENRLIVSVLPAFVDYEKDSTSLRFDGILDFTCNGVPLTRSLVFRQEIEQRNNYAPEFSSSSYEFILPLPLPQNLVITSLLQPPEIYPIYTLDYDLGDNNNVAYRIDGVSFFEVTTEKDNNNGKRFNAVFRTNQQILRLTEPLTFTLYATDNGPEPKTTNTIITLRANPEQPPMDPPHFEKALYTGTINVEGTLTLPDVVLVEASYSSDVRFELAGDDSQYFAIQNAENVVTVALSKPIPEEFATTFLSCWVEAKSAVALTGRTAIVVQLPQSEVVQQMTFGKTMYVGSLKKTNELILEDVVLTEQNYDETVKFTLEGADMEHFEITNERNVVRLQLLALPDNVLLSRYFFSLQVKAENEKSVVTTTTVIIENENFQTFLKFESTLYTGSLTEASVLTLEDAVIDMTTFLPGISVELFGEHKDWFTATLINNLVAIDLAQPVTETNLNGVNTIELVLVASKSGLSSANAVISIVISRIAVVDPLFEQLTYLGRLTDEGLLQLPTIQLTEATYTSDVEFSFQDSSGFFEMKTEENLVVISLKVLVTREDWTALNSVTLVVGASKPKGRSAAHAAIVIEIIKTEANSPRFEKILYVGDINEVRELVLENVVIAPETYGPDVQLKMIGDDFELFTYDNVGGVITVRLARALTDLDLLGKAMLKFVFEAFRLGAAATQTGIVLNLPSGDMKILRFEKPLYRGTLNPSNELTMAEDVVLIAAVYEPDVKFTVANDPTGVFEITVANNVVSVRLARLLSPEELNRWHALSFTIEATLEGAISGIATVAIEVTRSNLITPVFEKRTYRGSFDDSLTLTIEKLVIDPVTYTSQVEIFLSGSGFELFKFTNAAGVITIETQRPMIQEDFEGRSYFQLEILAKRSDAEQSVAGILIDVPLKECDIPPDDQPFFEYSNYHFKIQTDTTGLFGNIEAKVADPTGVLQYSMDTNNPYLLENVQIDAQRGELKLINVLIAGEYDFAVLVTNINSGKSARSNVLLTVESQKLCPGEKVHTVAKSLMIVYLEENSRHDIMSTVLDDCEYEIVTVEPSDKPYFSIDQSDKRLIVTPFDREDVIFQGSAVPQFQVKLKLNCLDDAISARHYFNERFNLTTLSRRDLKLTPVDPSGNYLVATKEIFYSHDITTLNVIVKDVNDNAPRFTSPQSSNDVYVLGYPNAEIAEKIIPPYLFKVEAEDDDEGSHAAIRYSMNANSHFDINPTSGVIYPFANAMDGVEDVEIVIEARDMDGVLIGSQATLQKMLVKRLQLEHLIVLTVANEKSENIERIIGYIKESVGLDMRVLNQAMISTKIGTIERLLKYSRQDSDSDTMLRLIAYGFDDKNELQDADEIEEFLTNLGGVYRISLLPATNFACLDNPNIPCKSSNTGLIVGISILGGLLLLSLIVGGVFLYIFYIPYLRNRGEDSSISSSKADLADDFNTSPPTSSPAMDIQKRSSVYIEGTTLQESESDQAVKLSKSLGTMMEDEGSFYESNGADSPQNVALDIPDSPKDRAKTIKFNELVERIEVVDDAPDDDDNESSIKL